MTGQYGQDARDVVSGVGECVAETTRRAAPRRRARAGPTPQWTPSINYRFSFKKRLIHCNGDIYTTMFTILMQKSFFFSLKRPSNLYVSLRLCTKLYAPLDGYRLKFTFRSRTVKCLNRLSHTAVGHSFTLIKKAQSSLWSRFKKH